jgi:transcriptional regulator with GAF, ATPase, and Fis domain
MAVVSGIEFLREAKPIAPVIVLTAFADSSNTRAIHRYSDRGKCPFVAVNCAAIPRDLLESELFGHVKGAFSGAFQPRAGRFQEADGGTLFLDEIGDMPLEMQAKILRVLQDRVVIPVGGQSSYQVNIRILAATHQDLGKKIQDGNFRQDLYFRLNVLNIRLPPLRERGSDIHCLPNISWCDQLLLLSRLARLLLSSFWNIPGQAMYGSWKTSFVLPLWPFAAQLLTRATSKCR